MFLVFAIGQSSGSSLSTSDIQHVVQQNSRAVKDACWGPDGGASDVRVTVEMNIAASGKVRSAFAAGNDRSVSRCIESQVKTWVFPASNGETKVNIPFHFVRTP